MANLKLSLKDYELASLATIESSDFWTMLKRVIESDLSMLEKEIRTSPKFSDDDLTEDLRFKMGGVDRLKWVLELPREAKELIK